MGRCGCSRDSARLCGFAVSSRLGEANSRLGRDKFAITPATGILSQVIDLESYSFGQSAIAKVNSRMFPVEPGILPSRRRPEWAVDITR